MNDCGVLSRAAAELIIHKHDITRWQSPFPAESTWADADCATVASH
jgi:hypothetical protein